MSRKVSIIEACKSWSRPEPIQDKDEGQIREILAALCPGTNVPVLSRWTGSYVRDEFLKPVSGHVAELLKAVRQAREIVVDERLRPELAAKEAAAAKLAIVGPVLEKIAKTAAAAIRARVESARAFEKKILELSAHEPLTGNEALVGELRAQEARRYAREIHDAHGVPEVITEILRPAMDSGRFDVVDAISSAFPPILDSQTVEKERMAWGRANCPETAIIERDLAITAKDVSETAFSILGNAEIVAMRTCDIQQWKAPADLKKAQDEAAPLVAAGAKAQAADDHAAGLRATMV